MSPSETTPSTWPSMSQTGKPEIRLSTRIRATSLIGASGPIVSTCAVISSRTLIVASFNPLSDECSRSEASAPSARSPKHIAGNYGAAVLGDGGDEGPDGEGDHCCDRAHE